MNLRFLSAFALVLLCFTLAGCVSTGRKLEESSVDKIKKGETTKEEVRKLLGPPSQTMRDGDGNTSFIYSFLRSALKPQSFIPGVGMLVGGGDVQNQTVTVKFNPAGIVTDVTTMTGGSEVGFGANAGGGK